MTTLCTTLAIVPPAFADDAPARPGDQELIALGLKFALAIMDEHHHTALIPPDADLDTEIALMAAACAPTQAMFEEIERRTATTLEGHLVKALARRWDDGYPTTRAAA